MSRAIPTLALLLCCGCAAGTRGPGTAAPPGPAAGKAPYDAAPVTTSPIDIAVDARAARAILSSLARPKLETSDVKVLEDLPAVRLAIQDSARDAAVFERDFAAAFQSDTGAAVFDFRSPKKR